jgi:hypothetical protein
MSDVIATNGKIVRPGDGKEARIVACPQPIDSLIFYAQLAGRMADQAVAPG